VPSSRRLGGRKGRTGIDLGNVGAFYSLLLAPIPHVHQLLPFLEKDIAQKILANATVEVDAGCQGE
jgi:hypothetical protein